jgi:hypothetical protein
VKSNGPGADPELPHPLRLKNKLGKVGVFLALEKSASCHHVKTTIHHVLTIKKPRSVHPFFENPPQKHQSTMQKNVYKKNNQKSILHA